MLPNDTPPRLCPKAEARLAWLARHLSIASGRVVTQDEAIDLAVADAVDRAMVELLERHLGRLIRAGAATDLSLVICRGSA